MKNKSVKISTYLFRSGSDVLVPSQWYRLLSEPFVVPAVGNTPISLGFFVLPHDFGERAKTIDVGSSNLLWGVGL